MFDSLPNYYTDYLPGGVMELAPHQERVVTEKQELGEKLDKLKAFIMESPIFKTLHEEEQKRLNLQYDAMAEYYRILGLRIAAF